MRRIRFSVPASRGTKPTVYAITREGFRAAQAQPTPRGGTYIPTKAVFRDSEAENPRAILHDLHAASWVFALEDLAPEVIGDWYGPVRGRLECPRRREGEGYRPLAANEVAGLGRGQGLADLRPEGFETIVPDVTVEVEAVGRRNELLVEIDRSRRGVKENNRRKFVRYDALLCGWWRALGRYREREKPPVAIFVCVSEEQARSFVEVADRLLAGAVHREGKPRSDVVLPRALAHLLLRGARCPPANHPGLPGAEAAARGAATPERDRAPRCPRGGADPDFLHSAAAPSEPSAVAADPEGRVRRGAERRGATHAWFSR